MNPPSLVTLVHFPPGLRATGWLLLAALLAPGCSRAPSTAVPPSHAAEKPRLESELARITLPKEAVVSLQIRSQPAQIRLVQDQRPLTGWIMARPEHEVTLTAPVGGFIRATGNAGTFPIAGLAVEDKQPLLMLEPVLSPLEQIQLAALKRGVENEEAKARESVTVADSELRRMQELFGQKLRGQQDVEQARARLQHARADLAAARDKLKLFGGNGNPALLPLLPIQAPRPGTVLTVHVSPGQYVPVAAPLVTIIDLREVWVRVPVPEQDLGQVALDQPAQVLLRWPAGKWEPGKTSPPTPLTAQPVGLVPQVDPVRRTADLLYQLKRPAKSPRLSKEQMVTVLVPYSDPIHECVIPYPAVVFDAHSGAWVYLDRSSEKTGPLYERRRVEVGPTIGEDVVIRPALAADDQVVVQGAGALFSREFHKPPLPKEVPKEKVDDDDD